MRIAFLDGSGWDYTVDTPLQRPFGGSQSAMCYLAVELARLGHSVTIHNGIPAPTDERGVEIVNFTGATAASLNSFDVVVVLNNAIGRALRWNMGVTVPIVLWSGHAPDQPAIQPLGQLSERKNWSGFAFVSQWQLEKMVEVYGVRRDRCCLMRNAISPAFADMAIGEPWFVTGDRPTLFYTSTPFRGLDVLLSAFPSIRTAFPEVRLRVFSSMSTYQYRPDDDKFGDLYERCRTIDGVEYVGAIGQSRLACELAGAAALAYPSTFAETSCIAALEALAIGAAVLTTSLGALPETTNGFARMIQPDADKTRMANAFAIMVIEALRDMQANPSAAIARRNEQLSYIRANYLWPARAKEWERWLSQLAAAN
jgi:glycosyltransferase involved in cell wall biosynthesis